MAALTTNIKALFDRYNLEIPNYQRPYKWTRKNIEDLLNDIENAISDSARYKDFRYRIGAVLIHDDREHDRMNVVDGQQRIISLFLIYKHLDSQYDCYLSRHACFSNRESQGNIQDNSAFIRQWFSSRDDHERNMFISAFEKTLEVVVITVDDPAEAFQLFDSQNSRGKPLNPHDLLKAYHLREMTDDLYEMEHAVEKWEDKDPKKISEIFEAYLFPVLNWSRCLKSESFKAQHIDVFKGIEAGSSYSYARRAVKSSPVFQITEPFTAGDDFFKYVDHYLSLLGDILREMETNPSFKAIHGILENKGYNGSTGFRHCKTLFYCSALCYYDRFHSFDKSAVLRLFTWAMMLRVDMDHLGFDTTNKYAIGDDPYGKYTNRIPMFSFICNARRHTDISSLEMRFRDEAINQKRWGLLLDDLKKLNGR